MDVNPLVPFGAIAAALIAGCFSFLNLVMSKEQKVSEFRQAWIDKLREDVSKYVAAITYLASANAIWVSQGRQNIQQYYESMRPSFDNASQSFTSIVLRINPSDGNSETKEKIREFLLVLDAVRDAVRNEKHDDARQLADSLSEKMQPILKYEWERVKKGERIYRFTMAAAIFIVVVGVVAATVFVYRAYVPVPGEVAAPANQSVKPTR